VPLFGFWAHLGWDVENHACTLAFLLDLAPGLEPQIVDVGPWSVEEGIEHTLDYTRDFAERAEDPEWGGLAEMSPKALAIRLRPLLALIYYLGSEDAEIEDEHAPGERPTNPVAKKTRHGMKLFPAEQPRLWTVGKSMGAALRQG